MNKINVGDIIIFILPQIPWYLYPIISYSQAENDSD
jgi:hypothetical protein